MIAGRTERLKTLYTESQRAEVWALVKLASELIPPLWPLRTAIAVNPLVGLEELDFEDAIRRTEQYWASSRASATRSSPTAPISRWPAAARSGNCSGPTSGWLQPTCSRRSSGTSGPLAARAGRGSSSPGGRSNSSGSGSGRLRSLPR